jgi:trimeric autotransporter adhesin
MNPLIQLKTTPPLLVTLALLCFGVLSGAQAVVPPPDGGYPNFTTAEGTKALQNLSTGSANTAVGWFSLWSNAAGSFNTATGAGTLLFNTADENTAFGAAALLFNTTGFQNTAVGSGALVTNTTGFGNVANGDQALNTNTTGNVNTAIGTGALFNNTTGGGNTVLGRFAGGNITTADNVICIGNQLAGLNVNETTYIAGISGTAVVGDAVVMDGNGQLGTIASATRFKTEIKPMGKASEAILALNPVSFRYKSDTKCTPQFGLVAEEVANVNSDLVVRDRNREIYSVRYEAVNAMLLNEFLKEHLKVEQLKKDFESKLAEQQKQIEVLTAGLQKVSAQLELSKTAPQTVLNDQ